MHKSKDKKSKIQLSQTRQKNRLKTISLLWYNIHGKKVKHDE